MDDLKVLIVRLKKEEAQTILSNLQKEYNDLLKNKSHLSAGVLYSIYKIRDHEKEIDSDEDYY